MIRFFKNNMDGDGGIYQLLIIAVPVIISQSCDTIMMFTDRLFLSQLSPTHMAASMSGGFTAFVFTSFFLGLTEYATPLVAQYLGSGNEKKCPVVITQTIIIALLGYPVILGFIPLGHWLFGYIGQDQTQFELSSIYFNILMFGSILSVARNSISSFFSGIGKTKIIMFSSLVTMLVNVMVNYVLILGKFGFPSMGIIGSAIGTISGNFCGLTIITGGYLWHHKKQGISDFISSLYFDKTIMKKLLKFGYPGGLEFFLNMVAYDFVILFFHSYGADVAAAVTIAFNWDIVSFIPLLGINIGVTSLTGRFMGAKKTDLVHRTIISALKLTSIYGALMFFIFTVFPEHLSIIFIQNPENNKLLVELTQYMVTMIAFYVIAHGFHLVFSGALMGAGDTFWAMIISVASHWLLVIETLVLIKILKFSPEITWAVYVFTMPIVALTFFARYKTGKWKAIKVIDYDQEYL